MAPAAVARSPVRAGFFTAKAGGAAPQLLPAAAAAPAHAEGGCGANIGGRTDTRRDLLLTRLAEAAAKAFRQQRDKVLALRLLVAWRRAAARERSKREALSRLLRGARKRGLSRGFCRWRAGAQGARIKQERRAAREGASASAAKATEAVAAAAKAAAAAGAATTGKAAAEKLAREREKELQRERSAGEELRRAVEKLQAEVGVCLMSGMACSDVARPRSRCFVECCHRCFAFALFLWDNQAFKRV